MIKPRAIRKLPECVGVACRRHRCLLYSHNPFLVCAVHPEGVNSDSCLDFRLDPNAEAQLWEPEGARYIDEELVIERVTYNGEEIIQPQQQLRNSSN